MNTYDIKSLNCLYHENISENITHTQKYTHNFIFNNFFSENRDPYEIMREKYGTAGQVTDDNSNMAHAFHMPS
jgi:hypothetical protein